MSTGRYVSDLEVGDILAPVTYVMSPFIVREYCHGVDEIAEEFHRPAPGFPGQLAPPTLTHIDKIRIYKANCPDGPGPHARIHYQFHARCHRLVPVGAELTCSGRVARRYEKKGRVYVDTDIELRLTATDELLISYQDTVILGYSPGSEPLRAEAPAA
ncbi:MAG: MaoC family dehydratase N-terminal domain-containing protein [Propionibacteriaceae bacterium]|jgi:hypothetical protein|nr:MaoC family dehydratase N-terminal domain-containing protein [Propionibacteriaceae bacterium]